MQDGVRRHHARSSGPFGFLQKLLRPDQQIRSSCAVGNSARRLSLQGSGSSRGFTSLRRQRRVMNNNRIGVIAMASIRITTLSAAAGAMALASIGSVAQAAPTVGALPVLKAEAVTNSQVEQVRHGGGHWGKGSFGGNRWGKGSFGGSRWGNHGYRGSRWSYRGYRGFGGGKFKF
jgi:hypothetical protein